MNVYELCKEQLEHEQREARWTGTWISWILLRMFSGLKESWNKFAEGNGLITKQKRASITKSERKRALEQVSQLEAIFAAHDWSHGPRNEIEAPKEPPKILKPSIRNNRIKQPLHEK